MGMTGRAGAAGILQLAAYGILGAGLSLAALHAASGYARAASQADAGSSARVAGQYVRMKARQSDIEGYVSVRDGRMVYMLEEFPEGDFVTDLYDYDGWLAECLHGAWMEPELSAGDKVLPCDGFYVEMDGDTLMFSTWQGGAEHRGAAYLRGGTE